MQLWRKDTTAGAADEYGDRENANAPILVAAMWGSLVPMGGSELYTDAQREAVTRYVLDVGWIEGKMADPSMFLTFEGRQFDIVVILPDARGHKGVRFQLDEKKTGA